MSLHPSRFQQLLIATRCFAICQTVSSISLCQDVAVVSSSEATADKVAMTDVKSTLESRAAVEHLTSIHFPKSTRRD